MHENISVRFWSKIDRRGPTECWLWMTGRVATGYGAFSIGGRATGRQRKAHQVAWELANGQLVPDGLIVRHSCDIRLCCNPAHLLVGTYADNAADMVSRNRQAKGERAARAKLTDKEVAEIREAYATGRYKQSELAVIYRVSQPNISMLITNRSRGHL